MRQDRYSQSAYDRFQELRALAENLRRAVEARDEAQIAGITNRLADLSPSDGAIWQRALRQAQVSIQGNVRDSVVITAGGDVIYTHSPTQSEEWRRLVEELWRLRKATEPPLPWLTLGLGLLFVIAIAAMIGIVAVVAIAISLFWPSPLPTATVVTDSAILCSGPSIEYTSIATLPQREKLTLLGRTPNGAWLKVRTEDGTEGWVSRGAVGADEQVIEKLASVSGPPLPTPTSPPTVTPTAIVTATNTHTSTPAPPSVSYEILLDCSSLMEAEFSDSGYNKLEEAKRAIRKLIGTLVDPYFVAIRVFGHNELAPVPSEDTDLLLEPDRAETQRNRLSDKLDPLKPSGCSAFASALREGLNELLESGSKTLVLTIFVGGRDDCTGDVQSVIENNIILPDRDIALEVHLVSLDAGEVEEFEEATQLDVSDRIFKLEYTDVKSAAETDNTTGHIIEVMPTLLPPELTPTTLPSPLQPTSSFSPQATRPPSQTVPATPPTPISSPVATPVASPTNTLTATSTVTATPTNTPPPTSTDTPMPTYTPSLTPTKTATPTSTPIDCPPPPNTPGPWYFERLPVEREVFAQGSNLAEKTIEFTVFYTGTAIINDTLTSSGHTGPGYCIRCYHATQMYYSGWDIIFGHLDISMHDALEFYLKGDAVGRNPNVYLVSQKDGKDIRNYVDVEKYIGVTTDWQKVEIPLKDFQGKSDYYPERVDLTDIHRLQIIFEWEEMSGTIFIDDMRFR